MQSIRRLSTFYVQLKAGCTVLSQRAELPTTEEDVQIDLLLVEECRASRRSEGRERTEEIRITIGTPRLLHCAVCLCFAASKVLAISISISIPLPILMFQQMTSYPAFAGKWCNQQEISESLWDENHRPQPQRYFVGIEDWVHT